MKRYCNVEPILHLLADKDLLDTVNVGAVLQALQHGLYNGEVRPVVHAHWRENEEFPVYNCSNCCDAVPWAWVDNYSIERCPFCGAIMDEKEGNL